jgi:hypothetical protein
VIELQNSSAAQINVENVNSAIGGQEVLNYTGLTEGLQYYVGVRNYNNSPGGTFTICIAPLMDSHCNDGSGTYNLCSNYKAAWTGANSYTYNFVPVNPTPGSPTAFTSSSQAPLASPSLALRYSGSYTSTIDAVYNLTNGIGGPEVITVPGNAICNVTIGPHSDVQVQPSQRCPATLLRISTLQGKPFVCGSVIHFEYEFTEINCSNSAPIGLPFVKSTAGTSAYLLLNFTSPQLVAGACYSVRIRPVFPYGPGTWGTAQCIKMSSSAMQMQAEDINQHVTPEKSAEEVIAANIYPNPTNGEMLNLNITGIESSEVFVRILDGMGRQVYSDLFIVEGSLNTVVTFERPLASGIYLVEFSTDGKVLTERMVVQK